MSLTFLNNYFYYFQMSNFEHRYNAKDLELMPDLRENAHALSAKREDVLDSLLNLILNHKKEIQKVPGTSTLRSAQEWCAKRPGAGFRADEKQLGGDDEKEIVIYDKSGKPYIINGYKLKPSDYGMRKYYQAAVDKDPEGMIGTSMRDWTTKQIWSTVEDDENKWNRTITKNTAQFDKLKSWGYRMPTKPKKYITPYSIFSKLIAEQVRFLFTDPKFYETLANAFGIEAKPGAGCHAFFNKIVSPISVYRFLYLRLVEQKYYWSVKETIATRNINTFEKFKDFIKSNKNTFRNWFIKNVMGGENKERFVPAWINIGGILKALVKGSIQLDGSDIQDGLVFLLSPENLNDEEPVVFIYKGKEQQLTFRQLLINNDAAGMFNAVCADSKNATSKACKKRIAKWKKNAETSTKSYFKNKAIQKAFFEDEEARTAWLEQIKTTGLANADDAESVALQKGLISSPIKNAPVVELQAEEPVNEDDDDDEKPQPLPKGQMTLHDFV